MSLTLPLESLHTTFELKNDHSYSSCCKQKQQQQHNNHTSSNKYTKILTHFLLFITVISSFTIKFTSGQFINDVVNVEMFPKENAKAHRTTSYEITERLGNPSLVIRRGDPFYLAISLRQPYEPQRDKIRLEFMFGKINPSSFYSQFTLLGATFQPFIYHNLSARKE